MFRNYLKIAISRLVKNKFFPTINIIGLSLGITACLLIMMYVINELSYESFQIKRQNIYRVAVKWGNEGNIMKFAGSMPALAPAINEQVPEVEVAVRIRKDYDAIIKNKDGQEIKEDNLFFADQGIFDIFSFYLKQGDSKNALADPYSVVISEKMATKYFGSGDASGKTLLYNDSPLKITGIMHNISENTHLKCDFLVSYSTLKALGKIEDHPWNSWGDDLTYILMKKKVPANTIIPKLDELLLKNTNDWFASRMKFEVQPLKEIHWETESRGDLGEKGNMAYVYIFLSAAIFVLMIACFNFLNLSISQFLGRMKEVGIRKTFGAMRNQLIFQFLTESMVIILISALIGVLLFEELYINLYTYLGTVFVLTSSHFLILSSVVLFIVVIIGVIAGGYPALYISRFRPIEILRNETSGLKRKLTFRKLLIMFQFTISIVLLVGTIFIFHQLKFMKNSNLGFTKENVVLVNFQGLKQEVNKKYEVLRDELLKNSNIRYASGAYTVPGINSQMNMGVRPDGTPQDNSINLQALPVDYGFVKSLGLEIIDGRDFSQDYSIDRYESVLLNQAAVAALGLKKPVGTKLFIPGDEYKKGVIVIGVIKDFHVQSFHNKINPMMIYINPKMYISIVLKVNPQNINETISYIKKTWTAILPGSNMNFKYLEDAWDNLYSSEKKSGQLLSVFTALALFISCLGLFGFASFIVSKRVKEVGIRKVMGAQVSGISLLLSVQFTLWIIASSIIACPVAYILVRKWLQNFAFRVNISWWIFLVAVCFELIIAFLTVSWQSWRAATRNPVEALRYE